MLPVSAQIPNSLPYGTPGVAKPFGPREGTQDTHFKCSGKEISTAYRTVQLKNGMIDHTAKDNTYTLTLKGRLEVPHTGFSHAVRVDRIRKDRAYLSIHLQRPKEDKVYAQVVSPIFVDETFDVGQAKITELTITVVKDFNWGPSKFTCKST